MSEAEQDLEKAKELLAANGFTDLVVRRRGVDDDFPRRREVQKLLVEGYSNKEIGTTLGITEATVKVHAKAIFKEHGVTTRTQLAYLVLTGKRPPSAPAQPETA
jgi:DNA-binding NarL/FixJ family response regulator